MRSDRSTVASSIARRAGIGLAALIIVMVGGTRGTQDAIANGDTRTLTLYHNNTKESITVTFRRNGQYDSAGLQQLNLFLRDWRRDEPTRMDPRLFDTVWEVYREVGSGAQVHVNSGYRSPQTNSMLRRRSSAVAKNSQHMLGKAMDFYIPDASTERLRAIGMRLQNGGVGYYPNAYTPFVHLDVGSVRAWPRMTRDQLTRIFPDGKTVHIPADGTPLAGYEEARAEVLAKGGTVGGYSMVADGEDAVGSTTPRRKSLWATLFGGSDEDEDAEEIRAASPRGRAILAGRRGGTQSDYASDSNSSVYAALQPNVQPAATRPVAVAQPRSEPAPQAVAVAPASIAPALREELNPPPLPPTRIAGLPSTVETPNGPSLSWQQGSAGQGTNSSDLAIAKGMAFAPMPPRRPGSGTDEFVGTTVLAYAPIPPVRPGSLAESNPIPSNGDLRSAAPVVASASSVPLPPPRPGQRPVTLAAAAPVDIPTTGSTARDAAKDAKAKAEPAHRPAPAHAPNAAASALITSGPSLNMGFSAKPMGDLATNRFTGPAVKPLPVVR
ncbi:DUF882 domain-containing protein [Microvirga terricola]|uniref:Murein endopeptidase K n=1 Tax=Microvirga terricola TaxID=2719797 RepID=A0ABX0VDP1_9HYPH|nr:DUF882 domain-containing protein [Microvirga terricola]NIX77954.1 DUF882 domain-containing protein [Microvirga terricola]